MAKRLSELRSSSHLPDVGLPNRRVTTAGTPRGIPTPGGHCEQRRDEAVQLNGRLDCFALL
jgi:hypothetical protein